MGQSNDRLKNKKLFLQPVLGNCQVSGLIRNVCVLQKDRKWRSTMEQLHCILTQRWLQAGSLIDRKSALKILARREPLSACRAQWTSTQRGRKLKRITSHTQKYKNRGTFTYIHTSGECIFLAQQNTKANSDKEFRNIATLITNWNIIDKSFFQNILFKT